ELRAGVARDVVPPGSEGDKQLAVFIERDIAVHHSADAEAGYLCERYGVASLNVLHEGCVTSGESTKDVLHVVRPDPVDELVFPSVRARGEGRRIWGNERCFDASRTKLDSKHRAPGRDQLCGVLQISHR